MSHIYHDAGLKAAENEHHYRKEARNQVIQWSCRLGSPECLDETYTLVAEYLARNVKTHQDHWATILANGVRNASEEQFGQLVSKLNSENDSEERLRLITALSYNSNIELVKQYLHSTLLPQSPIFRSQDERYRAFTETVAISQTHTALGFEFLLANLDAVNVTYGAGNVNNAILRLSSFVISDDGVEQVFQK